MILSCAAEIYDYMDPDMVGLKDVDNIHTVFVAAPNKQKGLLTL